MDSCPTAHTFCNPKCCSVPARRSGHTSAYCRLADARRSRVALRIISRVASQCERARRLISESNRHLGFISRVLPLPLHPTYKNIPQRETHRSSNGGFVLLLPYADDAIYWGRSVLSQCSELSSADHVTIIALSGLFVNRLCNYSRQSENVAG